MDMSDSFVDVQDSFADVLGSFADKQGCLAFATSIIVNLKSIQDPTKRAKTKNEFVPPLF